MGEPATEMDVMDCITSISVAVQNMPFSNYGYRMFSTDIKIMTFCIQLNELIHIQQMH